MSPVVGLVIFDDHAQGLIVKVPMVGGPDAQMVRPSRALDGNQAVTFFPPRCRR